MDIGMDVAFTEACQALGESIVKERLLTREIARLSIQIEVTPSDEPHDVPEPKHPQT